MRGVINVLGVWLKILRARFARVWLSTYLPQILDTPLVLRILLLARMLRISLGLSPLSLSILQLREVLVHPVYSVLQLHIRRCRYQPSGLITFVPNRYICRPLHQLLHSIGIHTGIQVL